MYTCTNCGGSLGKQRGTCPHCGVHLWYGDRKRKPAGPPPSAVDGIVGVVGLLVITLLVWYFWPTMSGWYSARQVRSTADEFLRELGGRPSSNERRHWGAMDWYEMQAVSEKLQFRGFQSTSWYEFNSNPDQTAFDMTGTAKLSDKRKIPLSLRIVYENDRWQVQSFSFPDLPPDFLKEYALSEAKRVAEDVLTYEVEPDPLLDPVEYPPEADEVFRSLQFYNYQSTQWKETVYNPVEKLCILDGIATLKDGRGIPLSLRIKRASYGGWGLASISSLIQQSQVRKEYAVSQATSVANEFLTLLAKSGRASDPGPGSATSIGAGGVGMGAGAPGAGSDSLDAGELAPGFEGGYSGEWIKHYRSEREGPGSTDQIGRLFQKLRFGEYQSVQWNETTYEPGKMTCVLRGVATMQMNRTVPLSIRAGYCRPSFSGESKKNAWHVHLMTSP